MNTTGSSNTYIGERAGNTNTTGNFNTFIGNIAGESNFSGSSNTFLGYKAGTTNNYGNDNCFYGREAGFSNVSGEGNSFFGRDAGRSTIDADENSFFGHDAGRSNTYGTHNSFFGHEAGMENTDANFNTFMGSQAGKYNTTGFHNTCIGSFAGVFTTTGSNNVFIGHYAGSENVTGFSNINISGSLGSDTLYNTVVLGGTSSVVNKVRLGNTLIEVVEGQVGYSHPSDGRFKFNIQENVPGLAFIEKLRPVTYQFDIAKFNHHLQPDQEASNANSIELTRQHAEEERRSGVIQTGFIAQEVEAAAKELGFNFDAVVAPQNEKDNYGLRYAEFVVPLVKAVQELHAENKVLRNQLEKLMGRVEQLEAVNREP
jgi:hypothetical protein